MSCFKQCLGVKPGSAAETHIDNATAWAFQEGAKLIRQQAAKEGVIIPDTLEDKLYRYGVKNGLLPMREQDEEHYAHKLNLLHD